MSLKSLYERFLVSPNPLSLAENATLQYVPTLKSFSQSGPIVRHLENQNKNELKKKNEKTISAVEGHDSVALEVDTTLEFVSGGGAYLPGLEDFITDRIVNFPVTHIVHFDGESKIRLIRMSWDQGSLLKQVDVIGSRGKNWPIHDGKDQIRLIASNTVVAATPATMSPRGRESTGGDQPNRSMSPLKKHIKDPHASLDLYEPQKENRREPQAAGVAPRTSARPAPREMSDLFAAGHEDYEPSNETGGSPKKAVNQSVVAPKAGGRQTLQPSRLFEEDSTPSPAVGYKSDPAKYNHFSLGEELEDDPLQHKVKSPKAGNAQVPMRPKTTKHGSQWGFEDFYTPEKVTPKKALAHHTRNFSWSDQQNTTKTETPSKQQASHKPRPDANPQFEFQDDGPDIPKQAPVAKPRRDAETHFQLKDDHTPAAKRSTSSNQSHIHKGVSLYENNLYDDGSTEPYGDTKEPLKSITNNLGRKNDFDSHWAMRQDSSAHSKPNNDENKPVGENRARASKMMQSHWDAYDQSPQKPKKPAGTLRQGLQSHWDFGDHN